MRRHHQHGASPSSTPRISKLKIFILIIIAIIILVLSSSTYYIFFRTPPSSSSNKQSHKSQNHHDLKNTKQQQQQQQQHVINPDLADDAEQQQADVKQQQENNNDNNNDNSDNGGDDIPPQDQREAKDAQFEDPNQLLYRDNNNNNAAGFDQSAGLRHGAPSKLCALVLDTRSLRKFRGERGKEEHEKFETEDQEIVETVRTTLDVLENFHESMNKGSMNQTLLPELLLFRPFLDQPEKFPDEIFSEKFHKSADDKNINNKVNKQQQFTKISTLELSPSQLDKILVFDEDAHFDSVEREKLMKQRQRLKEQQQQQQQQQNTKHENENEKSSSTFIEAMERILLAIEATKIDPEHRCQSLLVINSVFSTNDDTQKRLGASMRGLLSHPSSRNTRSQLDNPQSFFLSPLIVSGSAVTHTSNIFSFGNEIVEVFEGLAWAVPRFYGMPIHHAGAAEEAAYIHSPSGVLTYFTPVAFLSIEKVIENQFLSHRYRLGREWIEKARGNYVIVSDEAAESSSGSSTDSTGRKMKNKRKQRNPNGIADVDVRIPSQQQHKSSSNIIENHLLVLDAALAELSSTALKYYNMRALAVRSSVPVVVFHEETPNTLSTRYMKAVANAATGLGSIRMGGGGSNKQSSSSTIRAVNSHASINIPRDQPDKVASLPAAWVIKALPFVTSIASDTWFNFVGNQFLPNTTLFWDPYCSCTGINIEAINFLVPLEKFVRTRAVAAPDCWCPGFPMCDQFALRRMQAGKLLNKGSTSKFHIWVSHKPVDAFPSFPYDGALKYDKKWDKGEVYESATPAVYQKQQEVSGEDDSSNSKMNARPDLVIGRTMIESDRISQDWVRRLNDRNSPSRVDELWVPSRFLVDAFRKSGVRKDLPIVVVPEAIDTRFYDPQFTIPHPRLDRSKICPSSFDHEHDERKQPEHTSNNCFVFLSNFKWEYRKGWDILLKSYFTSFTNKDNVVLVLKTYLYMDPEPKNPKRIRNKISEWIKTEPSLRHRDVTTLPKIEIVPEDLPSFHMPNLYRAADCFVLPTRGEGWGLPLQEAMTMGLVTIGTAFGGNLDFMPRSGHGQSHFLINVTDMEQLNSFTGRHERFATKEEIFDENRKSPPLFATPSVDHLSELMTYVAKGGGMPRSERTRMGRAARWEMTNRFGREHVTEIVLKRLVELYEKEHSSMNSSPSG